MATIFGGPGARAALRNIATGEQGQAKAVVEKALTNLFSEFGNSILRIETVSAKGTAAIAGTAFFVTENGLVLTSKHVVATEMAGTTSFELVASNGTKYQASLVATHLTLDIALLTTHATGVHPLHLAAPDFQVGESVSSMGYEEDQPLSVRTGLLSGVELTGLILTLPAGPGMSGSPILNSKGDVIGVLSGGSPNLSVVYAIPIRALKSWLAMRASRSSRDEIGQFQSHCAKRVDMRLIAARLLQTRHPHPLPSPQNKL